MITQRWTGLSMILLAAAVTVSCSEGSESLLEPSALSIAKGGTKGSGGGKGPSVSSVDPAHGQQGETIDVTVYGSDFDESSQATWELDGVPAERVRTNDTRYVSSTELVANISIASTAELDLYDVAVTAQGGRKKGVGIEMFEVTQAIALATFGGNSKAHAVNEAGQAAGFSIDQGGVVEHASYWHTPDQQVDLGPGHAWDMDEAGSVVVGITDRPVYWTGSGTDWTGPQALPVSDGVIAGRAFAIASDTITGQGFLIGGSQAFRVKGKQERHEPMLWRKDGSDWVPEPLPQPAPDPSTSSWANDVNARGQAVGAMDVGRDPRRPVFWDNDGSATVLGDLGGTAQGINEDGTVIVGDYDGRAVYWRRDIDGWTLHDLPGDCLRAYAVDAYGRILAARCGAMSRRHSVVYVPSGASDFSILKLGGLGDSEDAGEVEGMSRWGSYVGGSAPTPTVTLAAIWRLPPGGDLQ